MDYQDGRYYYNECYQKIRYNTKRQAKAVIRRIARQEQQEGITDKTRRWSAYLCSFCHMYHIGHSYKRFNQSISRGDDDE